MSRAFKCDRCNDLVEGSPNRHTASTYRSASAFGWKDKKDLGKSELCDDCSEKFVDGVRYLLEGDSQERDA